MYAMKAADERCSDCSDFDMVQLFRDLFKLTCPRDQATSQNPMGIGDLIWNHLALAAAYGNTDRPQRLAPIKRHTKLN